MRNAVLMIVGLLVAGTGRQSLGGVVTVTDANLVGDTYEYLYDPVANTANNGGVTISGDPWLTNTGWVRFPLATAWTLSPAGLGVRYNGGPIHSTVGFDFSGLNRKITKIEMENRHILFRWKADIALGTLGDVITGEVATPTAFGTGSFSTIYQYTGDGVVSSTVIGVENTALRDVTPHVDTGWLANPNLLEMKFSFDPDSDNTGNRRTFTDTAQLFRTRFHLRVTTTASSSGSVPEPSTTLMWTIAAVGLVAVRRRSSPRSSK